MCRATISVAISKLSPVGTIITMAVTSVERVRESEGGSEREKERVRERERESEGEREMY